MSRNYNIRQEEVAEAWKAVRQAGGAAGHDGQTIAKIKEDEENQLYKVWNRLTSGSYQAQPVLLVEIPKAKGGTRQLGIPTVTDRVAQMVIKNRLEETLQPLFHESSYAYQANKSAIDAVTKAREWCMKKEWVLEVDIKGFFDNIDHEILMQMVNKHTEDKAVILYARKFLEAKGITHEKEEIERRKGTPQGGVISPLLANLYLHEAFDDWMERKFPEVPFERYADDIIVHCESEEQAYYMKNQIEGRLKKYKLELHPEKTRVVYAGKSNSMDKRGHKLHRKFVFLGYEFKPRNYKGRLVFTPGLGSNARMLIRQKLEKTGIMSKIAMPLEGIAKLLNPKIAGWINYYGHHRRSELHKMAGDIDHKITKWLKKKHKKLKTYAQSWQHLRTVREGNQKLFCHWYMIKPNPTRAV